jgi:hypothetical protein
MNTSGNFLSLFVFLKKKKNFFLIHFPCFSMFGILKKNLLKRKGIFYQEKISFEKIFFFISLFFNFFIYQIWFLFF